MLLILLLYSEGRNELGAARFLFCHTSVNSEKRKTRKAPRCMENELAFFLLSLISTSTLNGLKEPAHFSSR